MKEQSSFRERAKFSRRILRTRRRILRSPMPNELPALLLETAFCICKAEKYSGNMCVR